MNLQQLVFATLATLSLQAAFTTIVKAELPTDTFHMERSITNGIETTPTIESIEVPDLENLDEKFGDIPTENEDDNAAPEAEITAQVVSAKANDNCFDDGNTSPLILPTFGNFEGTFEGKDAPGTDSELPAPQAGDEEFTTA